MFVVLSCIKFGSMKVKGCLNLMLLFFLMEILRWSLIYGHLVGDSKSGPHSELCCMLPSH